MQHHISYNCYYLDDFLRRGPKIPRWPRSRQGFPRNFKGNQAAKAWMRYFSEILGLKLARQNFHHGENLPSGKLTWDIMVIQWGFNGDLMGFNVI